MSHGRHVPIGDQSPNGYVTTLNADELSTVVGLGASGIIDVSVQNERTDGIDHSLSLVGWYSRCIDTVSDTSDSSPNNELRH